MNYFWNIVFNLLGKLYWFVIWVFSTAIVRFTCILKGIAIGTKCKFFGIAVIKRSNKGRIKVGNECVFRSMKTSNLLGISRPCILTAMGIDDCLLTIGNNCGFSGTVISCFERISIGNNVRCGANTLITDSDWHCDDERLSPARPVTIEDNVFLGVNVTVLKGVVIGKNSIIGAGSVVASNIPPNVVAAGNPCRIIRKITDSK